MMETRRPRRSEATFFGSKPRPLSATWMHSAPSVAPFTRTERGTSGPPACFTLFVIACTAADTIASATFSGTNRSRTSWVANSKWSPTAPASAWMRPSSSASGTFGPTDDATVARESTPIVWFAMRAASARASGVCAAAAERNVVSTESCTRASVRTRSDSVASSICASA